MTPLPARIAGAPISWGVCEVDGWGYQLPVERVLREMGEAGLAATEYGPDGFLPASPATRAAVLAHHGLTAAGGFVPVVAHRPDLDPVPAAGSALAGFGPPSTAVLVLAAATGAHGYDKRPELDSAGWSMLLANLDRLASAAAGHGYTATLHPHVGTMVETRADVERVLEGSGVPLCLDTGHLLIGGTDPAWLARVAPSRIAHVHLKDVRANWASRVQAGDVSYTDAVRGGMYCPLGQGDVDVADVVGALETAGYRGWYVLEQDTVLTGEPDGAGPVSDVRTSVACLRGLLR
ncbi:MAG TPA: TIM barrel protein [Streptosporangiaceae bacterium]|nr:TIM barrel protein [Streptosporangiaceae bacterium]